MSNFLTPFKKFLKNKNTVTIICIVIGVLTLVIGYNYRVSKATNLVTVPYAIKNIDTKTQITKDMIGHVKIPTTIQIIVTVFLFCINLFKGASAFFINILSTLLN